jgi:hypothetical protein
VPEESLLERSVAWDLAAEFSLMEFNCINAINAINAIDAMGREE